MQHVYLFLEFLQPLLLLGLQLLDVVEVVGGRLRLRLDSVEERQEVLRVLLKHELGAFQAVLLRLLALLQMLNFFLLHFQHVFDEAHLTLLLNQCPAILAVFGPLNRYVEASILVHLLLHLGINSEPRGLDVGLADLAEAALANGPIFLPNFELLIAFALYYLAVLLGLLERKYELVGRQLERVLLVITAII